MEGKEPQTGHQIEQEAKMQDGGEPPTYKSLVALIGTPRLNAALAKARKGFAPLKRTKTVTVQPREGRSYSYSYATLADVLESVVPSLSDNGLALSSRLESLPDGSPVAVSQLLHESGEGRESRMTLPKVYKMQEMGSALTYSTRYQYCLLLALAADDDDDANSADGVQGASVDSRAKQNVRTGPKPTPTTQEAPAVKEGPREPSVGNVEEVFDNHDEGTVILPSQAELFISSCRQAKIGSTEAKGLMQQIAGVSHSSEIPARHFKTLMEVVMARIGK